MKNIKSHFTFLKAERSGILCIILLIFIVQGIYFYTNPTPTQTAVFPNDKVIRYQQQIDSLKLIALTAKPKRYPFNPNFISDYKGFTLGMSTEEIDRLHAFRAKNKYVNSAAEFQAVTKVSDSLLNDIKPYFKFPEWVKNKQQKRSYKKKKYANKEAIIHKKIDINKATIAELRKVYGIGEKLSARIVNYRTKLGGFSSEVELEKVYGLQPEVIQKIWKRFYVGKVTIVKIDINKATIAELRKVYGIGEKLSARIVNYRTKLNGFVTEAQLDDVYGLKPEVIEKLWKRFYLEKPIITIINLNTCTLEELEKVPYINYELADEILNQRTLREGFKDFEELTKIRNFPTDKLEIIEVYLRIQ